MISISEMTAGDIPGIVEIELTSNAEPWTERSFQEELGRPRAAVLVARGQSSESDPGNSICTGRNAIVGFVCVWLVHDELQVLNIAVHRDWRLCGIGRMLLDKALQFGRENGALTALLEVRRSNTPARRLYAGAGFRRTGERPDYYGVIREPAIQMEMQLCAEENPATEGL